MVHGRGEGWTGYPLVREGYLVGATSNSQLTIHRYGFLSYKLIRGNWGYARNRPFMNAALSKAFRSVQVYFPGLQDLRFRIQRNVRGLLHKPHEHDFEALVHLPYQPNALFLDIGSNRGDAIQSILMQRPDARVMAFEPNTHLTDKVKKIYKNDPRVEVQNFGLGSKPGSFELFIPFYNRYMFDGLASFKERRARRCRQNVLRRRARENEQSANRKREERTAAVIRLLAGLERLQNGSLRRRLRGHGHPDPHRDRALRWGPARCVAVLP